MVPEAGSSSSTAPKDTCRPRRRDRQHRSQVTPRCAPSGTSHRPTWIRRRASAKPNSRRACASVPTTTERAKVCPSGARRAGCPFFRTCPRLTTRGGSPSCGRILPGIDSSSPKSAKMPSPSWKRVSPPMLARGSRRPRALRAPWRRVAMLTLAGARGSCKLRGARTQPLDGELLSDGGLSTRDPRGPPPPAGRLRSPSQRGRREEDEKWGCIPNTDRTCTSPRPC